MYSPPKSQELIGGVLLVHCQGRIFDGYMDWDDCGSQDTIGNSALCLRCLEKKIRPLQVKIEAKALELKPLQNSLAVYTKAPGGPSIPTTGQHTTTTKEIAQWMSRN